MAQSGIEKLAGKEGVKVTAVLYKGGKAAENEPRMLGSVEQELGLREFLEDRGHTLVVTADKDGPDCELERNLPDTDVLITTPFWPAYMDKERLSKASSLCLSLTAGVGSDHIDMDAAAEKGITVSEITGSNVVSVAEHEIMLVLALVRNFIPAHEQAAAGAWDIGSIAVSAFDIQDKVVGTVGSGRIARLFLQRLAGFDCKEMLYWNRHKMDESLEEELQVSYAELDDLCKRCDVIVVNVPLFDNTKDMFDKERIALMKDGSYLINCARGAICNAEAVKEAIDSGKLAGYAGDVWDEQPAPENHPWRNMSNNGMTPHYSGTTLDAQIRYAEGVKDNLRRAFDGEALPEENIKVTGQPE